MQEYEHTNGQSFFYSLLLEPSYRSIRHLSVWLVLVLLAFNQVAISSDNENLYITWGVLTLITFIFFLIAFYVNIYVLIPSFYLKEKYHIYAGSYILLILLLLGSIAMMERVSIDFFHVIPSRWSYWYSGRDGLLTALADFGIYGLSMAGLTFPFFLKHYLQEMKKVEELKKRQLQMEMEEVKERIDSQLLMQILNRIKKSAIREPVISSAMLMHLSRLLRYQLYEGGREKTLLSSEIQFIQNYLILEQLYNKDFTFSLLISGDKNRMFVPPLILFSFVKGAVDNWYDTGDGQPVEFCLDVKGDAVRLSCNYVSEDKLLFWE